MLLLFISSFCKSVPIIPSCIPQPCSTYQPRKHAPKSVYHSHIFHNLIMLPISIIHTILFSPNHNDNIRDNNLFLRHKSLISPIHKLPCNQFVSMLIMLGVFLCCSHFLLYQTPNSYLSLYVSFKSRFGKQQSSVPS